MKLLIIEDENAFRQVLETQFQKEGVDVTGVGTGKEALEQIEANDFDIVVTDLRLPDIDGIEIIRRCREDGGEMPFLLMTAYASVKTAVSALQIGAADYLVKPVRVPDLVRRVHQIHDLDRLKRENTMLRRMVKQGGSQIWFPETREAQSIQNLIGKVSDTDLTVLVVGESGTGKGMTARLIHETSNRADKAFIAVNCGAIPETLVESELFGHAKGSFTGADKASDGLFVAAEGGVLFLDEIGELPQSVQVKLLHALEEKTVRPVGSTKDRAVDVRIVAATNRDLEQMVEEGTFRKDLYFRLNVVQIKLPSLREMRSVLPDAVEFVIDKYKKTYDLGEVKITPEVWDLFNSYDWPGNIRELDNVIERALLLCDDNTVTLNDLPPNMTSKGGSAGHVGADGDGTFSATGNFKERVAAFEKHLIKQAIQSASGDRKQAADSLGIGLSTLYRKLEE